MTDSLLFRNIDKAVQSVFRGNLSEAFAQMKEAAASGGYSELVPEIDNLEKRYYYFLRFLSESDGNFSPEKDLSDISEAALELVGKILAKAYAASDKGAIGTQLRFEQLRPEENFESVVSDFLSELSRLRKDISAITDTRSRATLDRLGNDIFKRIWAAQVVSEDMERLVESLVMDSEVPSYFRELFVSATGLGATGYNSRRRIAILNSALKSDSHRVALNAEVWLAFAMSASGFRYKADKMPHVENIYHAAIRAIMPVNRPDMTELMNLGRSMADKSPTNPDLSGKEYEAIHKIFEAQNRGEDIFGGMLSHVRTMPFFANIANWFIPFHSDNSAIADIVDGEGAAVAELMESIPTLNDADKYGLMLSLSLMPEQLRKTQLTAMVDGLHNMSGTEEFRRALEESKLTDTMLIGQITGNIHRFFTENKDGRELKSATMINNIFYGIARQLPDETDFAEERSLVCGLAEAGRYNLAIDLFRHLPISFRDADAATLAAAALSAEKLNITHEAIDLYRLALKQDADNIAALTGLARIFAVANDYYSVAALLGQKEELTADNPELLRLLGTAYLRTGNAAQALSVFQNLDYLTNDTEAKALIACAMTATGDLENADIYFIAALENVGSSDLFIRRGIHLWLSGDRKEALSFFVKAFEAGGAKMPEFVNELQIAANEINSDKFMRDLPTIPEIIKYRNK